MDRQEEMSKRVCNGKMSTMTVGERDMDKDIGREGRGQWRGGDLVERKGFGKGRIAEKIRTYRGEDLVEGREDLGGFGLT